MKKVQALALVGMLCIAGYGSNAHADDTAPAEGAATMNLGRFSVSLAVKDLPTSQTFYEKLGFTVYPPEEEGGSWASYGKNWVILLHNGTKIGLFQGMFDENILTFNPTDVRSIQKSLKQAGIELKTEADETTTGPASAVLVDPDGNMILLDQHH